MAARVPERSLPFILHNALAAGLCLSAAFARVLPMLGTSAFFSMAETTPQSAWANFFEPSRWAVALPGTGQGVLVLCLCLVLACAHLAVLAGTLRARAVWVRLGSYLFLLEAVLIGTGLVLAPYYGTPFASDDVLGQAAIYAAAGAGAAFAAFWTVAPGSVGSVGGAGSVCGVGGAGSMCGVGGRPEFAPQFSPEAVPQSEQKCESAYREGCGPQARAQSNLEMTQGEASCIRLFCGMFAAIFACGFLRALRIYALASEGALDGVALNGALLATAGMLAVLGFGLLGREASLRVVLPLILLVSASALAASGAVAMPRFPSFSHMYILTALFWWYLATRSSGSGPEPFCKESGGNDYTHRVTNLLHKAEGRAAAGGGEWLALAGGLYVAALLFSSFWEQGVVAASLAAQFSHEAPNAYGSITPQGIVNVLAGGVPCGLWLAFAHAVMRGGNVRQWGRRFAYACIALSLFAPFLALPYAVVGRGDIPLLLVGALFSVFSAVPALTLAVCGGIALHYAEKSSPLRAFSGRVVPYAALSLPLRVFFLYCLYMFAHEGVANILQAGQTFLFAMQQFGYAAFPPALYALCKGLCGLVFPLVCLLRMRAAARQKRAPGASLYPWLWAWCCFVILLCISAFLFALGGTPTAPGEGIGEGMSLLLQFERVWHYLLPYAPLGAALCYVAPPPIGGGERELEVSV